MFKIKSCDYWLTNPSFYNTLLAMGETKRRGIFSNAHECHNFIDNGATAYGAVKEAYIYLYSVAKTTAKASALLWLAEEAAKHQLHCACTNVFRTSNGAQNPAPDSGQHGGGSSGGEVPHDEIFGSKPPPLTWTIKNVTGQQIWYRFYWPDWRHDDTHSLYNGQKWTFNIECKKGENICYGAWSQDGRVWGVGKGDRGCAKCCFTCGSGKVSKKLTP
ncbi:MAG: hypothetical protein HQL06_07425 [Nitrospirae bacterium]|nr:hypothetical protein [Nitrospirota bacterium]